MHFALCVKQMYKQFCILYVTHMINFPKNNLHLIEIYLKKIKRLSFLTLVITMKDKFIHEVAIINNNCIN